MFLLIRNADVHAPLALGLCDVLCAAERILAIVPADPGIDPASLPAPCEVVDLAGRIIVPGFIDGHVHVTGGGGEGGFRSRTPELSFGATVRAGVTTVVGVLGTDGTARSMEALVAKTMGLREEGLSAWCYTGSYRVPVRSLTGESDRDIMMVEPVIGIGELALSDHRSSQPSLDELARIASQARIGGMLSGKAGIVNIHLGEAAACLDPLEAVLAAGAIPRTQFLPTHCNRSERVAGRALAWAQAGGLVDFTASALKGAVPGGAGRGDPLSAARCYARFLEAGIPKERMSITSDGQGSLPVFDAGGRMIGLGVGTCASLAAYLAEAQLELGLPWDVALAPIASSPAQILKLPRKGVLAAGMDADFVALDAGCHPVTVVARGRLLMREGRLLVAGTFETADTL